MRWALWAAVSSLPQVEKISLQSQLELGRQHAAKWNGEVVAELVIPGESRSIVLYEDAAKRIKAYAQLKELIDQRAIDVLCFLDRSRLGRKASLSMAVVELCHEAGIITYDLDSPPATLESPATSHDDMLVGAIKSVGAQQQIAKLMSHHREGMIGRVERGELPSGVPPYGYALRYEPDGSKVVEIDDTAANRVRQMIDWYLDGAGAPSIAERFNAAGIPAPMGGQWIPVLVRSVLFRAWRYAGYGEVNRKTTRGRPYVRAKGNWPPIIPEATAERVFAERDRRLANRKVTDTPYLLSGVVWCIICDRPMGINSIRRNRPSKRRQIQLRCRNGVDHPHREISYNRVLDYLRREIEALTGLDFSDISDDANEQVEILAARIANHESSLRRLQANLHRADDAYVDGRMELERYERQMERIKAEMDYERSQIAELTTALADEQARGTRRQRMEQVAALGLTMLDGDPTLANAWLRERVRVWVEHHTPIMVEWL